LPANTKLPASVKHTYGTVSSNQRRVHLKLIESGASQDEPFAVLGNCVIDGLPADLPVDSKIEVLMEYDSEARVHVSARDLTSGKAAEIEITREQNLILGTSAEAQIKESSKVDADLSNPNIMNEVLDQAESIHQSKKTRALPKKQPRSTKPVVRGLDSSERPVALCNQCGEPQQGSPGSGCSTPETHSQGVLSSRNGGPDKKTRKKVQKKRQQNTSQKKKTASQPSVTNKTKSQQQAKPQSKPSGQLDAAESEFWDLLEDG
jgi:molecular chaperone DnaK